MPVVSSPPAIVMPRYTAPYVAPRVVVTPSVARPTAPPRVVMPSAPPAAAVPPRPAYVPPPIYYAPRPSYAPAPVIVAPPPPVIVQQPVIVQPAKQPFWKRIFSRKRAEAAPTTFMPRPPAYVAGGAASAPEFAEPQPAPAYAQPLPTPIVDPGRADVFIEVMLSLLLVGAFTLVIVLLLRRR